MNQKLQHARVSDFQRRAEYSPDSVYTHPDTGWEYIPIHPFADDLSTLRKLDIKPSDCQWVDAWCHINDDATLLQVYSPGHLTKRPEGFYARLTDDELEYCYLTTIVKSASITRTIFEHAMVRFAEYGFPNGSLFANISIGETITLTTQNNA